MFRNKQEISFQHCFLHQSRASRRLVRQVLGAQSQGARISKGLRRPLRILLNSVSVQHPLAAR